MEANIAEAAGGVMQVQYAPIIMKRTMDVAENNAKALLENMHKVNNRIPANIKDPGKGNVVDKFV